MAEERRPRRTSTRRTGAAAERPARAAAGAAASILALEDDPFSQTSPTPIPPEARPIRRPAPRLAAAPLPIAISGAAPPAREYFPGTAEFRYWTAAETLRRGADFWGGLLPAGSRWHATVGARLRVDLDLGDDLNAYYTRVGLEFYHATAGGRVVYSGESPDILAHELGHAVLDALRPQLWDAASIEASAFHESFGDMSAILVALQLPTLRDKVLIETEGRLYRTSRLSRVAEQLGWAIRQRRPDAVDPDSLRNAVNSFFYRDPATLPPSGPASLLTSAPHSFSRVFTGGFFEALAGMLAVQAGGAAPTEVHLLQVSQDAGRLLVDAIAAAPVVPSYFSQVAAHMIEADRNRFGGRYRDVLKSGFVRHGVLSLEAAGTVAAPPAPLAAVPREAAAAPAGEELPLIPVAAAEYGLGVDALLCHGSTAVKRYAVAGAAPDLGSVPTPAPDEAARYFVEDLLRRGRIAFGAIGDPEARVVHPAAKKTHELVRQQEGVELRRLRVDCGFDCD